MSIWIDGGISGIELEMDSDLEREKWAGSSQTISYVWGTK